VDRILKPIESKIATSVAKTRNNYAIFAYDFSTEIPNEILQSLKDLPGVLRVRTIWYGTLFQGCFLFKWKNAYA